MTNNRRTRYVYARSFVMMFGLITLVATMIASASLYMLVHGIIQRDGERIVGGLMGTGVAGAVMVFVGLHLLQAWKDARTLRRQLRR